MRERNNEEKEIRRERDTETQRERERKNSIPSDIFGGAGVERVGGGGGGGFRTKKKFLRQKEFLFFYLRGILRHSFNAIVSAIYRDIRLTCPRLLCLTLSSFHDFNLRSLTGRILLMKHSRSLFCLIQPMTQATPIHNRL